MQPVPALYAAGMLLSRKSPARGCVYRGDLLLETCSIQLGSMRKSIQRVAARVFPLLKSEIVR
jgi:hypothetical protein